MNDWSTPLTPADAELVRQLDDSLRIAIEEDRPLDALRTIRAVGDVAGERAGEAAKAAVDGAASWTDVGAALGISKQAAHQRLSKTQQRLAKIDEVEERTHDKISRKFATAREHLARHPKASTRPDLAEKLTQAEQEKHEQTTRKFESARRKVKDKTDEK